MSDLQSLLALNKSSARLATFAVRTTDGRTGSYTFKKKQTNEQVTIHKFETWLGAIKFQSIASAMSKGL